MYSILSSDPIIFNLIIVEQLKGEIGILRGEIVRFRTNIHRMSCQYQQEESRHVTSCHVTLEDHRLAVAQLEG